MNNSESSAVRGSEPYHFQRDRQLGNKQPRPSQPGYQPNQLPRPAGWGLSTRDYYNSLFADYLKNRR